MKSHRPLVLMNKTLQKRVIHNTRYSTYFNNNNNKINNENKNVLNIFRPKFCQKAKSNDKSLKKQPVKSTIETSLKIRGRNNYNSKFDTLNYYHHYTTTVSTNISSNKSKHNKCISNNISNNKETLKKEFLTLNSEALSTNETFRLRNNLTMRSTNNNKLERSRSGKRDCTQKSTPASLVPSTTDKNTKININLNEKKFQDILKTSKFNFECQNKLKEIKTNINSNNNKNNINNNANNNIRSINDIKKECLATMRASEKVQTQILMQGEKILNTLEKRYLMLNNNKHPAINLSLQENINNINLGIFSTTFINTEENFGAKNKFTSEEYKQLLDTFNMIEYGPSILDEYFIEQENIKNVLEKHTITPQMRLKMVDWMVEIFTIIQTNDVTFFNAVNIMDKYFYKTEISYKPSDLHLIGICAIFIASKFCDINPIRLKFLIEKIGHGKFNKEEIIKMEEQILSTLQYDILKPTIYEFTSFFFEDLFFNYENNFNIKNKTMQNYLKEFIENQNNINISLRQYNFKKYEIISKFTDNLRNFMKCILIYLLKMCCQDYEIMKEKKPLISASCIVVGLKICEQINKDKYIDEFIMERLQFLSKENIYCIMELSSKILFRAQNYEKFYPGVKHLYKTHFENLTRMQNTK